MTNLESSDHLGVIELIDVCESMASRCLALFHELGTWVVDTCHPGTQRLFAEAAHRHGWHAELWAARAPAVPGVTPSAALGEAVLDSGDRIGTYHLALKAMLDDLRELDDQVHPLLDPSTVRTIELTRHDVTDLLHRVTKLLATNPA